MLPPLSNAESIHNTGLGCGHGMSTQSSGCTNPNPHPPLSYPGQLTQPFVSQLWPWGQDGDVQPAVMPTVTPPPEGRGRGARSHHPA